MGQKDHCPVFCFLFSVSEPSSFFIRLEFAGLSIQIQIKQNVCRINKTNKQKMLFKLKVYDLHYQPRGGSVSLWGGCWAPGQGETATFIPSYITSHPDKVHQVRQPHTNSPDVCKLPVCAIQHNDSNLAERWKQVSAQSQTSSRHTSWYLAQDPKTMPKYYVHGCHICDYCHEGCTICCFSIDIAMCRYAIQSHCRTGQAMSSKANRLFCCLITKKMFFKKKIDFLNKVMKIMITCVTCL